jgi:Flp pilus assembly protein TadB
MDRSTQLLGRSGTQRGTSVDASFVRLDAGQLREVGTARWVVGVLYALVGILWIIRAVIGTLNYLYLGFGIVWLLGSVCWPLGIHRHRRQRSAAIKDRPTG